MNDRIHLCQFVLLAVLTCSAALAQQQPPPPQADTGANAPKKPMQAPVVAPQDAGAVMRHTGGSLLQATMATTPDPGQAKLSDLSFFAVPDPEPRLMRKHDLVTIIVREVSEFKSEGTTDLKKTADLEAKIDSFIRFSMSNFEIKNNVGTPPPEIKMNGARNFKGEATVDRTDSLIARITAEVVDVKPNGTLILQARKRIKTDEEVQQFVLTGICRAEDVMPDNTVLSTQMYDLELNKSHQGAVRDTTKRGWLPKLLDAVNPF